MCLFNQFKIRNEFIKLFYTSSSKILENISSASVYFKPPNSYWHTQTRFSSEVKYFISCNSIVRRTFSISFLVTGLESSSAFFHPQLAFPLAV